MSDTPHLKLPLIEASQAQKHVTHNEALMRLDAVCQLAVKDRTRTAPPGGPHEGDRHIVAVGATGAWAGRDNRIAHRLDGIWTFLEPEPGWFCWDADPGSFVAWTGSDWVAIETGASLTAEYERLGVNTTPDATNRLAVKSNAVLFAPVEVADGGNGDVRFVVTKEASANTASLLFQDAWSGRAEIGLAGDDALRAKVSADGSAWSDVFVADPATGALGLPNGAMLAALNGGPLAGLRNLLINGDFAVNQRGFAGGALAAGSYGHDRWKAGAGGADYSVAAGVVTLASGSLVQVIEDPGLAGETVTVSVDDPSADITVDVAGTGATIFAGSGRRGATVTLDAGATGEVTLSLSASGASFRRVQLETGALATPFERRPVGLEQMLCARYYTTSVPFASSGYASSAGQTSPSWTTAPPTTALRAAPAVTVHVFASANLDVGSADVLATDLLGATLQAPSSGTGRIYWRGMVDYDAEF
ncbi:hypothetical protein GGD81_004114 [Rhodobium orientis]|uniref:DUF2793 domain-containing protein n=1 Tax=Rhodobium orientis TaxID=34017 RepID=A0A327JHP5_9HYPH|nr:DUF2793 domain-containing protein [Rhodobium orientis]MBB4305046.1 hypothetical protein [Rhodobium orientis]MBK5949902.1 hypothetical protein [Rhodobium orientis]RAI24844.1 hypothetical protein CH339_20895 [Rhodobium orientis]